MLALAGLGYALKLTRPDRNIDGAESPQGEASVTGARDRSELAASSTGGTDG